MVPDFLAMPQERLDIWRGLWAKLSRRAHQKDGLDGGFGCHRTVDRSFGEATANALLAHSGAVSIEVEGTVADTILLELAPKIAD